MRITLLILITLLLISAELNAQKQWLNQLVDRTEDYVQKYPQEKLFLHLDRRLYFPGETIWYKIYQVDGTTLKPNSLSQVIYINLVNREQQVVEQQKIYIDNGIANGDLQLKPGQASGLYQLEAYTSWMKETEQEIFNQPIRLLHPDLQQFHPEVSSSIENDETSGQALLTVKLEFDSGTRALLESSSTNLSYALYQDKKIIKSATVAGNESNLEVEAPLSEIDPDRDIYFKINLGQLERNFQVNPHTQLRLQLFPEGGNLIAGIASRVAYEFSGASLSDKSVTGEIINQDGKVINKLNPGKNRVGAFMFLPMPNERYTVRVFADNQIIKQYPLDKIRDQGHTLSVSKLDEKIRVRSVTNIPDPGEAVFIVQARGLIFKILKSRYQNNALLIDLPKSGLPLGVIQFTLFDQDGIPHCERLIFNKPDVIPEASLKVNKRNKDANEVSLNITLDNSPGNISTNYSLAVVDNRYLGPAQKFITDYLLLTSETVNGASIPVGELFELDDRQLDFFMMTKGWSRFDWKKIQGGDIDDPLIFPEQGMPVNGRVSRKNKPLNNAEIILSVLGPQPQFYSTNSNSDGEFSVEGVNFYGKSDLLINAETAGGATNVDINLDKGKDNSLAHSGSLENIPDYMLTSDLPVLQNVRYLDNLTIEDKKLETDNARIYGEADHVIDFAKLSASGFSTIWEAIQGVPGVSVTGNTVRIRGLSTIRSHRLTTEDTVIYTGDSNEPLFLLNNVMVDKETFDNINPLDIETIEILKTPGKKGIYGSRATNGVILVFLKDALFTPDFLPDDEATMVKGKGILKTTYQGYYRARQFYHPPELTEQINYQPATLHWAPTLKLNGSTGNITFDAPVSKGKYTAIIQGITDSGVPVYATCEIEF